MKWTNKGHELDELGAKYLQVKNIFIWGAGRMGKRMLGLLKWLKADNDFQLNFVDSDSSLHGQLRESIDVISPEQFFGVFDNDTSVLTICNEFVYAELINEGVKLPENTFINYAQRLPDQDFLRTFISIYLLYKHGKLLSPHTNYIITTVCNLNCRGCLNFSNYITHPADETFESFKKHIDTVFAKFDWLASFHFSGGEVMLHKELPKFLEYIHTAYGDRIHELFFVTNGTIIPTHELLTLMKSINCGVLLDDYRHSVPKTVATYPEVKRLLDEYGIWYNIAKADYWYELGISDTESDKSLTDEQLCRTFDECNVHYFQDFHEGKIAGCCYIGYANDIYSNKAGIYTPDNSNDYIDIAAASKMEILEYRYGYTPKGYFDLCRRCNEMHSKNSVHIPVAEQLPKHNAGNK